MRHANDISSRQVDTVCRMVVAGAASVIVSGCAGQLFTSHPQSSIYNAQATVARREVKSIYKDSHENRGVLLIVDEDGEHHYRIINRAWGNTQTEAAFKLASASSEYCSGPSNRAVAIFISPPAVGLLAQFVRCSELSAFVRKSIEYQSRVSSTESALQALEVDLVRQITRVDAALEDLRTKASNLKDENTGQWKSIAASLEANRHNRADLKAIAIQVDKASQAIRLDDDQIQSQLRDLGAQVAEIGKKIR